MSMHPLPTLPQFEVEKLPWLWATLTGVYPPGTTGEDLAQIKEPLWGNTYYFNEVPYSFGGAERTILHYAAKFKTVPAGTTAAVLMSVRDDNKVTPLEIAIRQNRLPTWITAEELIGLKWENGYTALHMAARFSNFPASTTVELLKNTAEDDGWTALHTSAIYGNLFPGTTVRDLLTTKINKTGRSALLCYLHWVNRALKNWGLKQTDEANSLRLMLQHSWENPALNVTSYGQLRRIGIYFNRIDPVATAIWMASEMTKLQQAKIGA